MSNTGAGRSARAPAETADVRKTAPPGRQGTDTAAQIRAVRRVVRAMWVELRATDGAARRERTHALAALWADMWSTLAHAHILARARESQMNPGARADSHATLI